MATAFDLTAPKTLVLTNVMVASTADNEVWNTGLEAAAGEAAVVEKARDLLPEIKSDEVSVAIYDNRNEFITLGIGDSVTVIAPNSEAVEFYKAQAKEGILTVEEAESST